MLYFEEVRGAEMVVEVLLELVVGLEEVFFDEDEG